MKFPNKLSCYYTKYLGSIYPSIREQVPPSIASRHLKLTSSRFHRLRNSRLIRTTYLEVIELIEKMTAEFSRF